VVIAMDDAPPEVRRAGVELELAALADLGVDAAELDLRDYFGQEQRLRRDLAGACLAWLRGGNVFMLRYALYRSGADAVFRELLAAVIPRGHRACPLPGRCQTGGHVRCGLLLEDECGAEPGYLEDLP
jgi:dipeptidase E